jgi:DNA-binding MarR family transcriptional regulator
MASPVFSVNESRILGVLGENRESSLPDLAVDATLTPSAVRQVVDRLAAKDLVRISGNFIRLTQKGTSSRNLIFHQQAFASLEDDDMSADEKAIDDALDAEMAKLEP